MLGRWGRFVAVHRRLVLALSGLGLVISIVLLATVTPSLESDGFVDEDSESARVERALAERFGRGEDNVVLIFDAAGPVSEPAARAAIEAALAPVAAHPEVARVLTTWNTGEAAFISHDGASTYAVAQLAPEADVMPEDLLTLVEPAATTAGMTVSAAGGLAIGEAITGRVEEDIVRAESISVPLTLLIQIVVFGGLIAAGVPLLVATLAIVGAVALIALLSTGSFQSIFAVNIITMLGLGLGVDYSLFMVARFREEIRRRPVPEAVAVAMATVGKAILFSGVTVIFGLAATLFFPLPALRSMGQAGMVVVALALVYGLSFLPALLAVLGPRINAIPIGRRRTERASEGGFWHRVAEQVMRRPLAVLVPVLVVLLVAGIPFMRLDLTPGGPEVLPSDDPARIANERLRTDFPAGEAEPVPVLITAEDGNALSAASVAALRQFAAEAAQVPGVLAVDGLIGAASASGYDWASYSGDPATLPAEVQAVVARTVSGADALVEIATDREGAALEDLVRELREIEAAGLRVQVGGFAGAAVDTVDGINAGVVPALLFVIVGSYVILLLTFGSVFLPLKAIFMTLLSITASLGTLVLVFQDGRLEGLLGFEASGEIISTTPILMFCILFGLSMDYEVLMLSRIQEEYARSGDNRASVALGLELTATVITGAAAIMIVVFGAFMVADIVVIKSMGFGLALAVLIDATIVRGLLVPATMRVMGDWNWWAPTPVRNVTHRLGLGHAELPSPRLAMRNGD